LIAGLNCADILSTEAVAAKKAPKSSATQKGKKTGQKTAVTEKSEEKDAAASAVEAAAAETQRKASAEKKATEEREKAAVTGQYYNLHYVIFLEARVLLVRVPGMKCILR